MIFIGVDSFSQDTVFSNDTVYVVRTISSDSVPDAGSPVTEWIGWAIGIVLFLFDLFRRIVPTWKGWTIIGKIDDILDLIAKVFNGIGNRAKTTNGEKAVFKKTKVTL